MFRILKSETITPLMYKGFMKVMRDIRGLKGDYLTISQNREIVRTLLPKFKIARFHVLSGSYFGRTSFVSHPF